MKSAPGRRTSIEPYRLKTLVEVELRFKNYQPAEVLAYLPGVTRSDSHAMRFTAKDILKARNYKPDLEP